MPPSRPITEESARLLVGRLDALISRLDMLVSCEKCRERRDPAVVRRPAPRAGETREKIEERRRELLESLELERLNLTERRR